MKKLLQHISMRLLLPVLLVFGLGEIHAQEILFNTQLSSKTVQAGVRFKVTFNLQNTKGRIIPPNFSDFQIIFGPSSSQSYNYINGKSSSSQSVAYILVAPNPGTFTIGSAKAETNQGLLETDPVEITVTKAAAKPNNNAQANSGNNAGSSGQAAPAPKSNGEIIVDVSVNKKTAYVGEPISVTYRLYSRYTSLELDKIDFPTLNGFWTEELKQENTSWENQLATINGYRYRVAVLKRQVIYPQKAGDFEIEGFNSTFIVNRSFFNPGQKLSVTSAPVKFKVKNFPSGKPNDFIDLSGSFKVTASADKYETKANEPITFKVKVSGSGNLKVLPKPTINWPEDFEVYDPKINDRISLKNSGLTGSREYEYLIIPRYAGKYEVPEITLSYFDLGSKSYKRISGGNFTFDIKPGKDDDGGAITYNPKQQNKVNIVNQDIRFIVTEPLVFTASNFLSPDSFAFWGLLFGLLLLTAAIIVVHLIRTNQKKDLVKYRQKSAGKMANKFMAAAEKALNENNTTLFYDQTAQGLFNYVSHKLSIPLSDLNRVNIAGTLKEKGSSETLTQQLLDTLDNCEMARFAPQADVTPASVLAQAKEIINQLEKTI